ncbi:hypothetical protein QTP88_012964 [Uroleucon formosanum]
MRLSVGELAAITPLAERPLIMRAPPPRRYQSTGEGDGGDGGGLPRLPRRSILAASSPWSVIICVLMAFNWKTSALVRGGGGRKNSLGAGWETGARVEKSRQ